MCESSAAGVVAYIHSFIHSLLVKLTYRSSTLDSSRYTIHTSKSKNSITVFIKRSCNKVFITQVTSLSWQLSVVHASSRCIQCVLAVEHYTLHIMPVLKVTLYL